MENTGSNPVREKYTHRETTAILIPIHELVPHPKNYRIHTPEQLEILKTSARLHEQQRTIVVMRAEQSTLEDVRESCKGKIVILAGHGYAQAQKEVWQELVAAAESAPKSMKKELHAQIEYFGQIECVYYTGTNPDAYIVEDNRSGDLAEDDSALLTDLLKQLRDNGADMDMTGYSADILGYLLVDPVESAQEDSLDEVPEDDFKEEGTTEETKYTCPKCAYTWNGKAD
jgi:hypothetical protein